MEGRTVILSVLIMSLVMAQIQVEAKKSCCPTITARNIYNSCRFGHQEVCAKLAGCILVDPGTSCPPDYPDESLQNSDDAINGFCKVGCAYSVCGAFTTLQNSDSSEIVKGAVEKCTKACSTFCTKGSMTALETA